MHTTMNHDWYNTIFNCINHIGPSMKQIYKDWVYNIIKVKKKKKPFVHNKMYRQSIISAYTHTFSHMK